MPEDKTQSRILVVDDDRIILDSLADLLDLEGYAVTTAVNLTDALRALEKNPVDAVITDINMPGGDGFELLRVIKQRWADIVVVMITGYGTIESAVEAIKMGAHEYLTKPIIDDEIKLVVERALRQQSLIRENQSLRKRLDLRYGLDGMVGHDRKMLKIFDLIESVADSRITVLMQGESGTGKSLVARCIHHRSDRREGPFVEVACGALPETLLESELFGHAKGAFTGATADKIGKFKAADGGTLFLDEIATASPALQVKLLRAIQEKQFEAVGSNKTEKVDVRLVLASNVNLEEEVAKGNFRQDLFYRVNVVTVTLPALRERLGDIVLLAERFLETFRSEMGKPIVGFSEDAIELMQRHDWPGNVRELENAVERAVVLAKGPRIMPGDLPPRLLESSASPLAVGTDKFHPMTLKEALEGPEKAYLEAALEANGWNRQATAAMLDINRTTLYKKMKRYGLDLAYAGS